MTERIEIPINPSEDMARELVELVSRCYMENPDMEDLRELENYLKEQPQLYQEVFNLTKIVQDKLIENIIPLRASQKSLASNINHICHDMAYDQSPMLERLVIDNVINCWLRLQHVELQLTVLLNREYVSTTVVEYWEKRLSASQRRYLRAIGTLARVRKLTRNTPILQVNIATEKGQQVNIAGDVVRKDRKDV